ncbi:MAG: radical SAM protein [Deltaproteobacteria bacterium]|nr:radical SAM protein [Deltaproteobacteria bacterium]
MKPFIIPIFLPQWGCPQQCVYCRQETITGERRSRLETKELARVVEQGLASKRRKKNQPVEIAFYGGNFTGLPLETQQRLLDWGSAYIGRGRITALRVSTRPDAVTDDILARLKRSGVETVELGFQALDDRVLERSLRGHRVRDNLQALKLVKEQGLTAGVQLMPGLPGDRPERFLPSLSLLQRRAPDFVRLYPALVFKQTRLAAWYLEGAYRPLGLAEALQVCARAVTLLESSGIRVLRLGLQATPGPDFLGNLIAGPFHPAFGDLVRGLLFREKIAAAAGGLKIRPDAGLEIRAGDRETGYLTGNGGLNLERLKVELGCPTLTLIRVPHLKPGEWEIMQVP